MKSRSLLRNIGLVAAGGLVIASLSGIGLSAQAAGKSTLIIADTLGWSSLNPGNPDENSVANGDVAYLTSPSWWYYDSVPNLVRNTKLGKYSITKDKPTDFEVTFTLNKGLKWSDGTPMDAVDMLLSHVVSSSKYSVKAGLGDPSSDTGGKFYSGSYGGSYDNHIVGLPILSKDHLTLTLKFDSYQPDWETTTPGPSPVHALELLAAGKTSLQSASANAAAKKLFLADFNGALTGDKDAQARLAKIGEIWTSDYNFDSASYVEGSKPLLTVSGGAFMLKSFDYDNATVTLERNAKYNTGPAMAKTNPVKTVVYKYVADGTPAVQALQNGDVDLYNGMSGAAGYSTLQTLAASKTIGLLGGVQGSYEHWDLRTGDGAGQTDSYNGPFASSHGQKGQDLRTAFLLALPRYDMMLTQLKVFNPKAKLLNTNFQLPGSIYYDGVVKANGVQSNHTVSISGKKYTYNYNVTSASQQAANEALALKLVQKWYPTASPTKSVVNIKLIRSSRQMRIENNALVVAHEANAGFAVNNETTAGWSAKLSENQFDVANFAWTLNAVTQTGSNAQYLSDGGNNHSGWNDVTVDSLLHKLEGKLTNAQIIKITAQVEALITANAWTLPVYQWPAITAYGKSVKGVKASPISPNVAWNYWQWHF